MNIQAIIVTIIVLAALAYVGQILWRKTKSFSSKSSCGAGCGCEAKQSNKVI
jgi:FeoB-associated Cys-rich membrane protein